MKAMRAALILVSTVAAQEAFGQGRPASSAMSCGAASRSVSAAGAIVLSTGTYTYDRFVSSARFCAPGESTEPAWVPTADVEQCFVGYRCRGVAQRQSSR
jgi:hypothetical protein